MIMCFTLGIDVYMWATYLDWDPCALRGDALYKKAWIEDHKSI